MNTDTEWRELNRAMWDEKTPLHLKSPIYDLDGFKAGRLSLKPHEIADLGDVTGKDLVHLQCHIGLDTLSLARLSAQVTGLDFCEVAVQAGTTLAREIGIEARFVSSDVYDAPAALSSKTYDIVYTGVGALCWLPDLDRWENVVRDLIQPRGQLYLFELDPMERILEAGPTREVEIRYDYFTLKTGHRKAGSVVYADACTPTSANTTVQWNHSLGEVGDGSRASRAHHRLTAGIG